VECIEDVLQRKVFACALRLHVLQRALDVTAVHLPRPLGRINFFFTTGPPFL
jgi:hypothetical protein